MFDVFRNVFSAKTYDINSHVYNLPLDLIHTNNQYKRQFKHERRKEILKESIMKFGVIFPIYVKKDINNTYVVVTGDKRFEISKELGLSTIPAIILYENNYELLVMEHIYQDELTVVEKAILLKEFREYLTIKNNLKIPIGLDQLQLYTGLSFRMIQDYLSIAELPIEILQKVKHNKNYTINYLRKLSQIESEEELQSEFNHGKDPLIIDHINAIRNLLNKYKRDERNENIFELYYSDYNRILKTLKKLKKDCSDFTSLLHKD